MRTLKKSLSLVLVLAMVCSFFVMGTSAAFEDQAEIDADYVEAVELMNTLGIIEGMMGDIKKQSGYLYHLILKGLADNPKILIGGESDKAVEFAKMMADMTSKSVIGKGELN